MVDSSRLTPYRALSSLFSRQFFTRLLQFGDASPLRQVAQVVGSGRARCGTAMEYLDWAYGRLRAHYPCEYVYKNEFLNHVVLKKRLGEDCVVVNEFKAAGAIADLAVFGDVSEAFEIKTTLDSPRRLAGQIASYARVFEKVTLIVPVDEAAKYEAVVPATVGLIGMFNDARGIVHVELRPAARLEATDPAELMKVLHAAEYRRAVQTHFGRLPAASDFTMYDACARQLAQLPQDALQRLFVEAVKSRRQRVQAMVTLRRAPRALRQISLAMGLTASEIDKMLGCLEMPLEKES